MTRRGNTLVEVLASITILTIVLSVFLRLVFATDRIFAPQGEAASATTALALLLQDVSTDVRGAGAISGGGDGLTVSGPGETRYAYNSARGGTVRSGADNRFYPGVRPQFAVAGSLVEMRLSAGRQSLSTAVGVRGR
ncbi:MAG TPA: prepilin-type N-terminal cleavage/methylation domain-containing protein [Armatimonadota bacterium]|jgi:type II secretory pathway pseudopilin PulG